VTDPTVRYAESDGVACIVLNRPKARNAISSSLAAALAEAFRRAESSDEVRVLLVTGADPAFCAGLDLKEFRQLRRPPAGASEVIAMAGQLAKPAVGAINGPAMTGGLELALGLDLLIASDRARFADTHAAIGILPAGGMTARLPRAVGPRNAMELSMTGRVLDAEEALRMGLVNQIVPHEELLAVALQFALTIAQRHPTVLRELKRLYRVSNGGTLEQALAFEIAERNGRRAAGRGLVPAGGAQDARPESES
jgi:enoyl-CoA hydratase